MIVLGIDCGTQSLKTIALDWENGEILASATRAYGLVAGLPQGSMEQEPTWWTDAALGTLTEVIASLGGLAGRIAAIGVSGQQHGLVALDSAGTPVRAAKLWCDTSTAPQCAEITAHFGGEAEIISRVGNAMLPGYTAPKILWLRQNEPENWARTACVLLPHDYLNFWLTGERAMEFGDASGTALLDIRERAWSGETLDFIAPDLREKLPTPRSSLHPIGTLRPDLAAALGLSHTPLVSAGGGDNMMGAIGTGNVRGGVVTASLGTSGTLYAFSENPVVDPAGEIAGFCDSTDHWLPLLCTMNVTLVTELTRDLFSWDHASLDAAAATVPPGADGLLLLPYLNGERTPNLPHGKGVLYGLTVKNFSREHLARAAIEGVTLGLGYGLRRLRELGVVPGEIRLTGGGSNSAVWRRICADLFGVPTVCLRSGQGAALGAAIQAGWAAATESGSDESLDDTCIRLAAVDESTRVEPTPDASSIYADLLDKSVSLRTTLVGGGWI